MKADGFFEPVSETEYGGWIKVAGKRHPLHDCKLIDGKYYDYSFDVLGYTVTIHAHIEDDGEIVGNAVVAGKKPMPCPGGIVRRTEKATGAPKRARRPFHLPGKSCVWRKLGIKFFHVLHA